MRYLHPVQAHERFVASARYRFEIAGERRQKTESWTMHAHPDGETFIRIDLDARLEEGKSILAEALLDIGGGLARFDIRYENASFDGGIKRLAATFQLAEGGMQVGYSLNGEARRYTEVGLPADCLVDVPLLALRGDTIRRLAGRAGAAIGVYALMFEHAQLFPGALRQVFSPVKYAGDDVVLIGAREIQADRFRYIDRAASYWIDQYGVIIKRVNSFKQREMVVEISNYAAPAG